MTNQLDISLIHDLPPFRDMDNKGLHEIISLAQSRRMKKDEYVFSQGENATHFFLLLDGYIRVVKLTQSGEQVVPRYISPGELFGIATVLDLQVYPASAVAAKDCVVFVWNNSVWTNFVDRYPTFASNTYHLVGQRLVTSQEQIVEFATSKVEQRVANTILRLANQTGRKTDDGITIDLPISRQDISEMTGTTLHTVSRLLSAWESKGWVKSSRQKISIVDIKSLSSRK